jgi:hypothetical protein
MLQIHKQTNFIVILSSLIINNQPQKSENHSSSAIQYESQVPNVIQSKYLPPKSPYQILARYPINQPHRHFFHNAKPSPIRKLRLHPTNQRPSSP